MDAKVSDGFYTVNQDYFSLGVAERRTPLCVVRGQSGRAKPAGLAPCSVAKAIAQVTEASAKAMQAGTNNRFE